MGCMQISLVSNAHKWQLVEDYFYKMYTGKFEVQVNMPLPISRLSGLGGSAELTYPRPSWDCLTDQAKLM